MRVVRATMMTFALIAGTAAIGCDGKDYDPFLESALLAETDLGADWVRTDIDEATNANEGLPGCRHKASKGVNFTRGDGGELSDGVVVVDRSHDCLRAYVEAVGGLGEIEVLAGIDCEGTIVRSPNALGTYVFLAGDESLILLTLNGRLSEDEGLFPDEALIPGLAERSCERLRAAEAENL